MPLKLVEVEFSVWPFVKAAKRAFWVSEMIQNLLVYYNIVYYIIIYTCKCTMYRIAGKFGGS